MTTFFHIFIRIEINIVYQINIFEKNIKLFLCIIELVNINLNEHLGNKKLLK